MQHLDSLSGLLFLDIQRLIGITSETEQHLLAMSWFSFTLAGEIREAVWAGFGGHKFVCCAP
jgi:hypothetical protein